MACLMKEDKVRRAILEDVEDNFVVVSAKGYECDERERSSCQTQERLTLYYAESREMSKWAQE